MGFHLYSMGYNRTVFLLNDIDMDKYDQESDPREAIERTCVVVSTTQIMLRFNMDFRLAGQESSDLVYMYTTYL